MRQLVQSLFRPSIRKQLIVSVMAVHAFLMLTFISSLVARQRSFLLDRARDRTLRQAELLAASAVPQLTTNDLAGLAEIVGSFSHDPAIRFAMVTDLRGRILGHTEPRYSGQYVRDEISQKQLRKPAQGGVVYQGGEMVESAAPVLIGDSLLGWAWVGADLRGDNRLVAAATRAGIVFACVAIATGGLFALLIAANITKPLRLLLGGADRLARDIFDERIPVTTLNEIGTLTIAFNRAMRKLRADRSAIEQAHASLEAEVIERRRAQQELESANRAIMAANDSLRNFAHVASHDLQEPLRAVAGFSDLLRRRYSGKFDPQADDFIDQIHSGAIRMQSLIRALLEYSRAGTTGGDPPQLVDATGALRAALENLNAAIQSTGASIEATDLPQVRAHEVAVVQLFQNLVSNAIKYAEERPSIRISAERDASYWRFAIADNGIGIEARDRQRIFGIFKRAHGEAYPGMGIGLAICSRIVERYGGRIWVESGAETGSTFYFTLPAP
jgi:signal transduction histidine kinase